MEKAELAFRAREEQQKRDLDAQKEAEGKENSKKRSLSFAETFRTQVQEKAEAGKLRKDQDFAEAEKTREAFAKDPYLFMLYPRMKVAPDSEKK